MTREDRLKKEIYNRVKEIYRIQVSSHKFRPGKQSIPYGGRVYNEKEMCSLIESALDFWLTSGRFTYDFERQLAHFLGAKHCITVNSGSSANLLALSALTSPSLGKKRLKPGDEVITTACGFPTTLNPILQNNLVPVFIDVELGNYNIQAEKIKKAVNKKTKVIFTAHTLGNPIDIDLVGKIVKKYDLWWLEDNCDALGSKYKGNYTGTFGHLATCSFYPAHHITMGEGGAVLTDDNELKRLVCSFRDWGRDCWCPTGRDNSCRKRFLRKFGGLPYGYDHKYVYSHIGYNMRITDMQAAIGVEQLKKLQGFIRARKLNFDKLYNAFKRYEDYFILPRAEEDSEPSWFGFPILVRPEAPFSRNDMVSFLENNKISTRMLFGGNLVRQPAYKDTKYRIHETLENTDMVMNQLFWIGVYPGINDRMMRYVIKVIDQFFNSLQS